MKTYFLIPTLILFIQFQAFCWGQTGHRAMGLIAERNLTPTAKKKLKEILKGESIAIASTWMDEIRSDTSYDYMIDWHWVTIETGQTYDKSNKNPKGDIIMTIQRIIAELKSGKVTGVKETEYVKILIHLIGDIHMPLHVGCCDDTGGNRIRVKWFKSDSNLHRIWDSEMIDDSKLSYTELAEAPVMPSKEKITSIQKASVLDWANESIGMRKQVYDTGDGNLGYQYNYKNFKDVKRRILEAGLRLAGVLNSIYG